MIKSGLRLKFIFMPLLIALVFPSAAFGFSNWQLIGKDKDEPNISHGDLHELFASADNERVCLKFVDYYFKSNLQVGNGFIDQNFVGDSIRVEIFTNKKGLKNNQPQFMADVSGWSFSFEGDKYFVEGISLSKLNPLIPEYNEIGRHIVSKVNSDVFPTIFGVPLSANFDENKDTSTVCIRRSDLGDPDMIWVRGQSNFNLISQEPLDFFPDNQNKPYLFILPTKTPKLPDKPNLPALPNLPSSPSLPSLP